MAEKKSARCWKKNGKDFIGIIIERDLTQKVVGKGLDPKTRPVRETMSSPLIKLDVEQPLIEANQFMAKHKIRNLAVTVEGKIEGVLSFKDLVAFYANPRLRH